MLDVIDLEILGIVEALSGARKSEIIRQYRGFSRSEGTISRRIEALGREGALMEDRSKEKGKVFVIITGYGRDILAEGRKTAQPTGAGQHD